MKTKFDSVIQIIISLLLICNLDASLHPARADTSDFLSLCNITLKEGPGGTVCKRINQTFFSENSTKDLTSVTPSQVKAPAMSIDRKIQFIVFNDPNYLPGMAYCYFVFRKWIDPALVSPDTLGLASSGFSILNEDIKKYQDWIANKEAGKACRKRLEKESGVPITNLEISLKGYVAIIGLNPFASVSSKGADFDAVMADLSLTLNHERIHAYQVLCPDFEKWGQRQWMIQTAAEKARVQKMYPAYSWSDVKIAGREYAAFKLEAKPESVLGLLGSCRIDH
ncbi:MAG: hypothetical protein AABZ06_10595 [Bdellovibrionota bacterium]